MFLKDSPYSNFFTSGLLSGFQSSEAPSQAIDGNGLDSLHRRGSLPVTGSVYPSVRDSSDDGSAFYFSLHFSRDSREFRSFLSLDLADSQSLRSVSWSRKTLPYARFVLLLDVFTTYL